MGPPPALPASLWAQPRRSASGPALHSCLLLPCQQQLPEEHKQSCCPPERPAGQRPHSQPCHPSAQLLAKQLREGGREERPPRPWHRKELSSCSTKQCPAGTRTHDTTRGWKGVARRMAACLARLCCCMQAPKTGPARQNGVVSTPGGCTPPARRTQ